MDSSRCKRQKIEIPEDRISNLHESIISRILSYLPIEDAVKTCLLSKQWKHRWMAITDLRFEDYELEKSVAENQRFMELVKGVLRGLGDNPLQDFSLSKEGVCNVSQLDAAFSSVFRRRLQSLELFFNTDQNWNITPSRNLLDSLVKLEITVNANLIISSPFYLPKLKYLHLDGLEISNDAFFSDHLFIHAPFLETFSVCSCSWFISKSIVIKAPLLKQFNMHASMYKGVSDGPGNCQIKILAPCLAIFAYTGYFFEDFVIPNTLSVRETSLGFVSPKREYSGIQFHRARKLIKRFSRTEKLSIYNAPCEEFDFLADLPIFSNVIDFSLGSSIIRGGSFLNVFHNLPMLESFSLQDFFDSDEALGMDSTRVPRCIKSSLKFVQFIYCKKNCRGVSLATYFLEKAKHLEELRLSFMLPDEVKTALKSIPRASNNAQIIFYD